MLLQEQPPTSWGEPHRPVRFRGPSRKQPAGAALAGVANTGVVETYYRLTPAVSSPPSGHRRIMLPRCQQVGRISESVPPCRAWLLLPTSGTPACPVFGHAWPPRSLTACPAAARQHAPSLASGCFASWRHLPNRYNRYGIPKKLPPAPQQRLFCKRNEGR